jgi:imidazole glycerol-phosphate synthase subunit HisF
MNISRIVPCLLIDDKGLYKTINFKNPRYLGDPFNTIRLFNGKEVDEIIILDIGASRKHKKPDFDLIRKLASECFMPICYGGGLNNIDDVEKVFKLGIDKVAFNTALHENIGVVIETIKRYGSQSVVASIDFKSLNKDHIVYTHNGTKKTSKELLEFVKIVEDTGVGEILITSIDKEGTFLGYDEILFLVCNQVKIPVAVNGGASSIEDMEAAIKKGASAAVAGSLFSYFGKKRAVIPNYPDRRTRDWSK